MISNFTFEGKHCLNDFDCEFFEDSRPLGPDVVRSAYRVGGRSGTVLFAGQETYEEFTRSGQLIQRGVQRLETEDLIWQQDVMAWLGGGRGRLIFDRQPDRYYWAQVDTAPTFGYKSWLFGSLRVELLMQPFAHAVQESRRTLTMTSKSATGRVPVDTGICTPLDVTIDNTGSAALQGVTITAAGKSVVLAGINVPAGKSAEVCLSGDRISIMAAGADARAAVQRLELVEVDASTDIAVQLATGSGTVGARVTLAARGRWIYG